MHWNAFTHNRIIFGPAFSQIVKDQLADLWQSNGSSEAVCEINAAHCMHCTRTQTQVRVPMVHALRSKHVEWLHTFTCLTETI